MTPAPRPPLSEEDEDVLGSWLHCYTANMEINGIIRCALAELLALRAVAAIPREPTEAMVDAAHHSTSGYLNLPGSQMTVNREKHRIRWRAMYDAALAATAKENGDAG